MYPYFSLDKNCYKRNRKYKDPFNSVTIEEPKDVERKVRNCQKKYCQENENCFYFSFNKATNECLLHGEKVPFENAEQFYSGPRFCGNPKYLTFFHPNTL